LIALDTIFDSISAESSPDIVITGGIGGIGDIDEISNLQFANDPDGNDLNVTLDVTDDIVDGSVNLSGSDLATLNSMGIDTITGDNGASVVIRGFTDLTLSDFIASGLTFADGVDTDSDLFVTLDMTDAGTVAFDADDVAALRLMGIDLINQAGTDNDVFLDD
jgi:hypothetical protein